MILCRGEENALNPMNPNFIFVSKDLDPEIFNKISNYDRIKVYL